MEQRQKFAMLACQPDANLSLLCRRFEISRKTGYKWIERYKQSGAEGLNDHSKCPKTSPLQTSKAMEQRIIELRNENPEWGAKKLHKLLENERSKGLFTLPVPARGTITRILHRHGLISAQKSLQAKHWQRFEYEHPNELWQMDFKGPFALLDSSKCYPLTITDDHSRFNIGLFACSNQRYETVRQWLCRVFETYGLPDKILTDNGSPWGATGQIAEDGERVFTTMDKWLISHQIKLIHGRAYHPQTQGKEERFHRTLNDEVVKYELFRDINHCQQGLDKWRIKYNTYRPHEAINLEVPSSRYKPSSRTYENVTTKPQYDVGMEVKTVAANGAITYNEQLIKIGKAFKGDQIAIKQTSEDGILEVYYYEQLIKTISLH